MLNDRGIREENAQLLIPRWTLLRESISRTQAAKLGMSEELATAVKDLDINQLRRACDCATPLFSLCALDDVIKNALFEGPGDDPLPFDAADRLIQQENYVLLLNRWMAVLASPLHAQCVFGMKTSVIKIFQEATQSDIESASRKGIRMALLNIRPKYFFHAGKNVGLQRSARTALAVCSSSSIAYY
jgi:hypothetical protein